MHVNAMGTSAPIFPCRVPTCFLSREHHVFDRLLHRFIVSRLNPRTPDQDGMLWSLVRSCKISGSSKNKWSGHKKELEMNWLHRNERVTSKLTQRPTAQNTLNLKVKIMQGAYDRHPKVPHELACNQSLIQRNARYAILLLKQPQQQNIKAVPTYEPLYCYHAKD